MSRNNPVPKEPVPTQILALTYKELKFMLAAMRLAEQVVKRDEAIMTFKGETVCRDTGDSFKSAINQLKRMV